jgi:2-C-methyl-D-erythritol 4-phosphate cytidylyltransferase
MKKNLVLILAGGSGSRMGGELPKQFYTLKNKTVIGHTIDRFEAHPGIDHIYIVTHPEFRERAEQVVRTGSYRKVVKVMNGGAVRQDSSRIGVMAAEVETYENVLIHDAARPFVSKEIIDSMLEKLEQYQAVNVAIPSPDTIIEVDERHCLKAVPDRSVLRRVQTPQGFKLALMQEAHRMAAEQGITNATDDCSLILHFDLAPVVVVEGSPMNIKITYPFDLEVAEKLVELFSKS